MFDLISSINSVTLRKEVTQNYVKGLSQKAQARVNEVHLSMDLKELRKLLQEFK